MSGRTLSPKELAEVLGGSPSRYKTLFEHGLIPGDKVGRRALFNADEVRTAIAEGGIVVRGMVAAKSDIDLKVESIEGEALQLAQVMAQDHIQLRLADAKAQGDLSLQIALHRKLADMIEAQIGGAA
jgi:predicted nucleotidyltransferase